MSRTVHPIAAGWVSTGGTGARNYDEFADDAEITELVAAQPDSMLAVEMPHRTPAAVAAGHDFAAALPAAEEKLAALIGTGALATERDFVAVYRIGADFHGVFCLVDTDQISDRPDRPGTVIRNEDVFAAKVAERTALIRTLGVLASPVLLLATDGAALHRYLVDLVDRLGAPAVTDTDHEGRPHAVWTVPATEAGPLLELAGAGELVVADGNHRSLAAQEAGLARFLAVVTTPPSIAIAPYHRLLRSLGRPVPDFLDALRAAGAKVEAVSGPPVTPEAAGRTVLYADGQTYDVWLPAGEGSVVDRLDHAVFERVVIAGVLGVDPADKTITYVGGDYPPSWLAAEVDAGRAAAAVLLAPVTVPDFVEVNLARLKMPRKSTWFVPKARTGLVLADVR